jgi:hypothetical protein
VSRVFPGLVLAAACLVTPARADFIGSSITTGSTTIVGAPITSTNSGNVTNVGVFNNPSIINNGGGNTFTISAVGAGVVVSILREGNPNAVTEDAIAVGPLTANNSGNISNTGTYNGVRITGGTSNGASISAAGSSVTISITHR